MKSISHAKKAVQSALTTPPKARVKKREAAPKSRERRPGGRAARVVRDVLDAAIEVFAERGYVGMSIDEIATRAGVNKTTVYRRWPTKSALVTAALLELRADAEATADTGDLRSDLLVVLLHKAEQMTTPRGRGIRRAILTGNDEPELRALVSKLKREHPIVPQIVLERAVERGELPPSADLALIGEVLVGALSAATMWTDKLDSGYVRRLIDLIVLGASSAPSQR